MLKIGRVTHERYVREGIITPVELAKRNILKVLIKRGDIDNLIANGII